MNGLLRKDYYLITKNLEPISFIALIPPIFVAMQNTSFLMPILSIVVPLLFAAQISTTMGLDESANWKKNVTAMPIQPMTEAGSKYILLFILTLISTLIVFVVGYIASAIGAVSLVEVMLYVILGFFYSAFYGFIIIPASYKYGTSSSKYFFMLFVFVPTFIPVILSMLNIDINLEWIMRIHPVFICLLFLIVIAVAGLTSLYLAVRVLKKDRQI